MPSARLVALKDRAKELRKLLLPSRFDATGTYNNMRRVAARTLSYRILVHAEIESYLEDRAIEIAKSAWREWKAANFCSTVTLHLLGFSGLEVGVPAETFQATDPKKAKDWHQRVEVFDRLSKSVSIYIDKIQNKNHGIKEKNLCAMLLPIGFDIALCNGLWVSSLNQFGESRGEAAHTSGAVVQAPDPQTEFTTVRDILSDLASVDVEFDRLLTLTKP